MDLGLSGRVAVIAASTRGLGRATAEALAAEGAHVVVNGRDAGLAAEVAASLGDAVAVPGDIADPTVPASLVEAAVERWGRCDIVVGNAGGPPPGRALDIDDAALHAAFEANALASIRLARAAVPHMRAGGWGRIAFIASASVRQPIRDLALSNVARTALWAWTKTAAQDLAEEGITVNVVGPGLHTTERMTSLGLTGRAGDPSDFGKVVAFACSEPAAFITGTVIGVDGGAVTGLL